MDSVHLLTKDSKDIGFIEQYNLYNCEISIYRAIIITDSISRKKQLYVDLMNDDYSVYKTNTVMLKSQQSPSKHHPPPIERQNGNIWKPEQLLEAMHEQHMLTLKRHKTTRPPSVNIDTQDLITMITENEAYENVKDHEISLDGMASPHTDTDECSSIISRSDTYMNSEEADEFEVFLNKNMRIFLMTAEDFADYSATTIDTMAKEHNMLVLDRLDPEITAEIQQTFVDLKSEEVDDYYIWIN